MKKSPNRKRYENVAVWCNFLLFSEIFLILRCFVKGLYKILQMKLIPEKALAEKSQSSRFLTSFVKASLCSFSSTPFLHSLCFAYFFCSGKKGLGVNVTLLWGFNFGLRIFYIMYLCKFIESSALFVLCKLFSFG